MLTICCSRFPSYPELPWRVVWSSHDEEACCLAPRPKTATSFADPIAFLWRLETGDWRVKTAEQVAMFDFKSGCRIGEYWRPESADGQTGAQFNLGC